MFSDSFDEQVQLRRIPVRAIGASVGIAAIVSLVALLYLATEGFTRGEIRDLSAEDRRVLDQLERSGILVRAASLPCTMQPHIVVNVNWQDRSRRYAVTAIGLRNTTIQQLLPYIHQLSCLPEIRAPYLRESELEQIRQTVPRLRVNRRS